MTCIYLGVPVFLILAAANAAATTRLSIGNEQVFRNFAPENDMHFLVFFVFFMGPASWVYVSIRTYLYVTYAYAYCVSVVLGWVAYCVLRMRIVY